MPENGQLSNATLNTSDPIPILSTTAMRRVGRQRLLLIIVTAVAGLGVVAAAIAVPTVLLSRSTLSSLITTTTDSGGTSSLSSLITTTTDSGGTSSLSPITTDSFIPLRSADIDISATWIQTAITVAGSSIGGNGLNQLSYPQGLYVDDSQTIYITEWGNHRVVEWKYGATSGQVVAGGNGKGNRTDQLQAPSDVIVDKERDSLIITDTYNYRVVRWPRQGGTSGETIISDIFGIGLTMDDNGYIYVCDYNKHEVIRWQVGKTSRTVAAGGNGLGDRLNQLTEPTNVFVDRDHSLYVSDHGNHRVMKWVEGSKEGIIVAGGRGLGTSLAHLHNPTGVLVDQLGTIYVAALNGHRIMRWPKIATQGSIIVGENSNGDGAKQLDRPNGLSFDRHGNLYVADSSNDRVQKFKIDPPSSSS